MPATPTLLRSEASRDTRVAVYVRVTPCTRGQPQLICPVLEVGTRPILDGNVTAHPTADWTTQPFRMITRGDQAHRFVIHDRDPIYSAGVDPSLEAVGLTVLTTPVRAPGANAFCDA